VAQDPLRSLGSRFFVVFLLCCGSGRYRLLDLAFVLRIDHTQLLPAFGFAASDTKDHIDEDRQFAAAACWIHIGNLQNALLHLQQHRNQLRFHSSAAHIMGKNLALDGPLSYDVAIDFVLDQQLMDHSEHAPVAEVDIVHALNYKRKQQRILQLVVVVCLELLLAIVLLLSLQVNTPQSRTGVQHLIGASLELDQIQMLESARENAPVPQLLPVVYMLAAEKTRNSRSPSLEEESPAKYQPSGAPRRSLEDFCPLKRPLGLVLLER